MLTPDERTKAIDLLTQNVVSSIHYDSVKMNNLIKNGHKGFAAYTDLELMRACNALAKKNSSYEIQNFVNTVAAEKFILE